jgi:N6-L-threonylcarbamoyladenine synthase
MFTIGIETSCDETSCAVLKNDKVLSNVTLSSLRQHKKYGGVIPEIATRAHLKNIDKVFTVSLKEAGIILHDIDLIAVTNKPGLMGALVIGLNFAKALAVSLNKPLIGINHLHAHIFAPFLNNARRIKFPFIGLIVSGGHSEIYLVNDFDKMRLVGATRDDACGEVYDKIARFLGLGYPGGPVIDKLFEEKYKDAFKFKCGRVGFDLSFSGIKTAVIYKKEEIAKKEKITPDIIKRLISSFQASAMNTITRTVVEAAEEYKVKRIVCGGGVIANRYLRRKLCEQESAGFKIILPSFEYTTDNAAMVAGLGFYLYNKKGIQHDIGKLEAEPN